MGRVAVLMLGSLSRVKQFSLVAEAIRCGDEEVEKQCVEGATGKVGIGVGGVSVTK